MPGDERKFKRRRIVAFMPTCNRDRELAASHTSIAGGIAVLGAVVDSPTGVAVESGMAVGGGLFVRVGEEIGIAVAVAVTDGIVSCGDEVGFTAVVDVRDAEAAGAIVGVGDTALMGEGGVDVGDPDAGIAG